MVRTEGQNILKFLPAQATLTTTLKNENVF